MPIATHFQDLGVGDGFGWGYRSHDISGEDYWTTLTGYNKIAHDAGDAVTPESIYQSKALAVRIYRNFYQLDAIVNATILEVPSTLEDITAEDDGRARSNYSNILLSKSHPLGVARGNLRVDLRIVALYAGPVDNPSNLVGYGLSDDSPAFTAFMPASSPVSADVRLYSYTNEVLLYTYEYGYVTLGGAHWVAHVRADGATTESVDLANLTASASDDGDGVIATSTIEDIQYYTYA